MKMITESDLKVLFSADAIQKGIADLGAKLIEVYGQEELYLICVL